MTPARRLTSVVFERQAAISIGGNSPVDEIDVEALLQVALDYALVPLKVENVVPIDEGVADEHRLGMDRGRFSPVAEEPEGPICEDDLVWTATDARFARQLLSLAGHSVHAARFAVALRTKTFAAGRAYRTKWQPRDLHQIGRGGKLVPALHIARPPLMSST